MKISIKGIEFDVTERYAEGHVCSAIEGPGPQSDSSRKHR